MKLLMRTRAAAALMLALAGSSMAAQAGVADMMIPRPLKISEGRGGFVLGADTLVSGQGQAAAESAQLAAALGLRTDSGGSGGGAGKRISLELGAGAGAGAMSKEAYTLSVTPDQIRIRAVDAAGLFYGAQSLRQLVQLAGKDPLPAVEIVDAPRFGWRGLLVDVANHFFTKAVLMQIMDQMAYYKLNTLHLHLTDNSGWRVAIPAYPKLTENQGGEFYTAEDIRELVAYGAQRHITIVPTVEMPGHSGAAARAYPEFFDGGDSVNPANPDTYRFIEAVFAELARLFPSPVLHFGGDELALGSRWDARPDIQALRQKLGVSDMRGVESYFDRRVAGIIQGLGRRPMAWDEAQSAGVGQNVLIQWWRKDHPEARDRALQAGHDVVLSPVDQVYFDYPQGHGEPGAPWEGNDNGPTSLAKILAWDPLPAGVPAAALAHVRGVEACLWSEYMRTDSFMQFMLYPRMLALAEVAWSPAAKRDAQEFETRLQPHFLRFDAAGINVRHSADDASKYMTH